MIIKKLTKEQYDKLLDINNTLKQKGLILIIKKNMVKLVLGFVCLGIAMYPNGLGFAFYPLSFFLLGIGFKEIENYKRKAKNKIRGIKFRA